MVKKSELVTGIILFCLSGIILLAAKDLPLKHPGTGFGPGAFPFIVGIGMLLLSLLLIARSFFLKIYEKATQEPPKSQWKPMNVLLTIMGYMLIMNLFGFLVSSILFLFVMTFIFGEKSYFVSAIYAGGVACLSYLFFSVWLKVPLPLWKLW